MFVRSFVCLFFLNDCFFVELVWFHYGKKIQCLSRSSNNNCKIFARNSNNNMIGTNSNKTNPKWNQISTLHSMAQSVGVCVRALCSVIVSCSVIQLERSIVVNEYMVFLFYIVIFQSLSKKHIANSSRLCTRQTKKQSNTKEMKWTKTELHLENR